MLGCYIRFFGRATQYSVWTELSNMIYLDNSATTRVRDEVIEEMLPYLSTYWGNPSSIHSLGRKSKEAIQQARERVALLLNCASDEIFFSSCGTASNNAAILGRARFAAANDHGRHLITTQIEHPSVMGPCQYLQSQGWDVTYLPVDREGFISLPDLEAAIKPQTSIITVMWANNEIGTVQNIKGIAAIAAEREIFFHTDAVQVPGKLSLDVTAVPISALGLSGHKFYAPKGIGVLYLRKLQNIMPTIFGGGQEMGILPGTEGLANIVAIGKAAELARLELDSAQASLTRMSEIIFANLLKCPDLAVTGAQSLEHRLPGHASFNLPAVEGEAIVMRADMKEICISSGSACHQGIIEPSQVLKAIGLSNNQAMGSVRVSAGRFNTEEECISASQTLTSILEKLSSKAKLNAK
jgi:cysteine desulfurase